MIRRDALFWSASALFVIGIGLGALFDQQEFLLLLVAANLLRPALYALGLARRYADERQLHIQFHAGNLALTVLVVAITLFAIRAGEPGKPADDFYALLAIGLAAKALVGLVMTGDHRVAGERIAVTIGLLVLLYSLFDAWKSGPLGILIHASPGLLVLAIGLVGRRLPRVSAILLGLAALVVFGFALRAFNMAAFVMMFIAGLPLLAAAYCFLKSSAAEEGSPRAGGE